MAKKVKIIIKDEELVSTVIGNVDKKNAGLVYLVIIFILLTSFIVFMPEITEFFENLQSNEVVSSETLEDVKDTYTNGMSIYGESVTLSNITLSDFTLSFNITNTTNSSVILKNDYMYLEVYDDDDNLIARINFEGINLAAGEVYQYQTELLHSDVSYFVFKKITESDYPEVELSLDENGEENLVCIKNDEIITFIFNNNLLSSVTQKKSIEDLDLENYSSLVNTYNSYTGVSASVESGFDNYFVYTVNLSVYGNDYDALDTLYDYKTNAKIINFEMISEGFDCN